jgi:phosphoribosylformylglycinamidine synthase
VRLVEGLRADAWLFGESQARMVVSVGREALGELRELASAAEVPFAIIGEVGGSMVEFDDLISVPVEELKGIWQGAFGRIVGHGQ